MKDTRLEVGHVASRTRNAQSKYDANAINPADRLAFAQSNASLTSLKPFLALQSGSIAVYSYHGSASYDSLQAAFNTRFRHDLTFAAVYTYSRTISDVARRSNNCNGNLLLGPFSLGAMRGLATIDRPRLSGANLICSTPALQALNAVVRPGSGPRR